MTSNHEAVLINIAIRREDGKPVALHLRYNDAVETFDEDYAVVAEEQSTDAVYPVSAGNPFQQTLLRFVESRVEVIDGSEEIVPRRVALLDAQASRTILYDDKNLMENFVPDFNAVTNGFFLVKKVAP